MNLILKSAQFAKKSHDGQMRKYSLAPYIVHSVRVAGRVILLDGAVEDWVCAAYLHDVMEDCGTTLKTLSDEFNPEIAKLVWELTNPSKKFPEYNREKRKQMDVAFIKERSLVARTIKLIDRIDNVRDMPFEESFKEKYIGESDVLLQALKGTNEELEEELQEEILWYREQKQAEHNLKSEDYLFQ